MAVSGGDVEILRTTRQFEADMLAAALDDAGIPYYRRVEATTGVRFTAFLGVVSFGNLAIVLVPGEAARRARDILQTLPFAQGDEPSMPIV